MDSTSPTTTRIVGLTSDFSAAVETVTFVLVERFFRPMPEPGFVAEDERTRHCADGAPGWHGTGEPSGANRGHPA